MRPKESELRKQNIEAQSFVADITDLAALKRAIQAVKKEFGSIDALEFSAYTKENTFTNVLETTPQSVLEQINGYLLPAILSVNEVLPEMINNGSGAIYKRGSISFSFATSKSMVATTF